MLTRAGSSVRAAREWTVEQTSHRPAGGSDSIQYRAAAVLYALLLDHPLDQRSRCRPCRRSGAMIGPRRRPCRIHLRARYWLLLQPEETLRPCAVTSELGLGVMPDGRAPTPVGAPWPR